MKDSLVRFGVVVETGLLASFGEALRRIVAGSIARMQAPSTDLALVPSEGDVVVGMTAAASSWLNETRQQRRGWRLRTLSLLAVIRRLETVERMSNFGLPPV